MNQGVLFVAIALGLIPGLIANRRGENFYKWWLFGALMFVVALPMAIMTTGKKCPACASRINSQAQVCPNCRAPQPAPLYA